MDLLLNDLLPTVLSQIICSYFPDIEIDGVAYMQKDVSPEMLRGAELIHFYSTFELGDGIMFGKIKKVSGVPKITAKSLKSLFANTEIQDSPDLALWDVSGVENLGFMFAGTKYFNCDLSRWDVSNAWLMPKMFGYTDQFNCDLSAWKPPKEIHINFCMMFDGAKRFRNGRKFWDLRNVAIAIARRFGFIFAGYPTWFKKALVSAN